MPTVFLTILPAILITINNECFLSSTSEKEFTFKISLLLSSSWMTAPILYWVTTDACDPTICGGLDITLSRHHPHFHHHHFHQHHRNHHHPQIKKKSLHISWTPRHQIVCFSICTHSRPSVVFSGLKLFLVCFVFFISTISVEQNIISFELLLMLAHNFRRK